MESAHNTLVDTGDYMSVSKHLTGEVQGRLSYGHVQRFYQLGLHKALLWVQMSCITVTEILHSLYNVCI